MKNAVTKILVVEDDEDDYVILSEMLSRINAWKVQLHWASSYEQARQQARHHVYDVCLMDYRLDRGTGLGLMNELQQSGSSTPVIVLTGHGDHEIDLRAMRGGAADYLEKDRMDPEILERSIRYTIEHAKTLQTLRRSERQLKVLSSKLMEVREKERKRLAHELHDSIGSNLAAVKLGLERELDRARAGNPTIDTELLEELTAIVETTIGDLKRIYGNLRPLIMDDLGFIPAIRSLIRQFSQVQPTIQLDQNLSVEEAEIPEPLKIVIYRICQEALNNISKHSGATAAAISLVNSKKAVILLIRDNGRGFDLRELVLSEERTEAGLGFESMKERVELSGGSFTVVSNKTKGTTIKAAWPFTDRLSGSTDGSQP